MHGGDPGSRHSGTLAAIIWRHGRAARASLATLAATRGSLARLARLRRVYVKKCWRRCACKKVLASLRALSRCVYVCGLCGFRKFRNVKCGYLGE